MTCIMKGFIMHEQSQHWRGLVFANVAVLFFGLAGVLGKLTVLPAPLIVFGRVFFAGLVLLAVALFQHIPLRPKRRRDGFLLLGQVAAALPILPGIYPLVPSFTFQNQTTLGVAWGVLAGATFALLSVTNRWLARKYPT